VAWGGIEPPTQGFSIQGTAASACSLSPRNVSGFAVLGVSGGAATEPAAELFGVGWGYGDRNVDWNQRNGDRGAETCRTDAEPMGWQWVLAGGGSLVGWRCQV
jgi:hypothetical protein